MPPDGAPPAGGVLVDDEVAALAEVVGPVVVGPVVVGPAGGGGPRRATVMPDTVTPDAPLMVPEIL